MQMQTNWKKNKQQQQLATKVKTNWNWNALNQLYIGIPNCNNNIHTTFLDWHVNCKLSQCKMSNAEDSELDPQIQVRLQPKPKLKCTCACTPPQRPLSPYILSNSIWCQAVTGAQHSNNNKISNNNLLSWCCLGSSLLCYCLCFSLCLPSCALSLCVCLFLYFAHTKSALVLISLTVDKACVCVCRKVALVLFHYVLPFYIFRIQFCLIACMCFFTLGWTL